MRIDDSAVGNAKTHYTLFAREREREYVVNRNKSYSKYVVLVTSIGEVRCLCCFYRKF